jgi:hypothetical protein
MCPTRPYGSIGMYSRWSQKMFYQRKFKSLHHVRRSGKRKVWIPLERWTRIESKELEGGSVEGPWEILLLPILRPFLGSIFKPPWILREVKERRERGCAPRFEVARGWMIEEREGREGKRGFPLLWPHGLTPGLTGQTGDGHRSDRWPPLVET